MIAVVEEGDIVGPLFAREGIESFYFRRPSIIRQEAEELRDVQWIVHLHLLHIRLAEDDKLRPLFGLEQPFHRRERGGLIENHIFSLPVARRKKNQERRHEAGDNSRSYE